MSFAQSMEGLSENLDGLSRGNSPFSDRRERSSGGAAGGGGIYARQRADSPTDRVSLRNKEIHIPASPERNGDLTVGRRYVSIVPHQVSQDLENFQTAPSLNQDKHMHRFAPANAFAPLSEHCHALLVHIDGCTEFLGITRFKTKAIPYLETQEVYDQKFIDCSPHIRETKTRGLAQCNLKKESLVLQRTRATTALRDAVRVRDELSRVPEAGETASQRVSRVALLSAAVEAVQRVESKIDGVEREEFDNTDKEDRVLIAYQEASALLGGKCFLQRQNDIVYLGRLKGAIDTLFVEIYRILALPGYAPLKSAFEKARRDPDCPNAPEKDQLKARNLPIIYGVLARRLRNVDDRLANLSELCRVVDTTRKYISKVDSMNYYFDQNSRMQAKDIKMVPTIDLMAILCLREWPKFDQAKFMDHIQMNERIRFSKEGTVRGESEPSFYDLIVEYLDHTEQNDLQRHAVSGERGTTEGSPRVDKSLSQRDMERRVEFELKQNHKSVLSAEAGIDCDIEERVQAQVREQLQREHLRYKKEGKTQRLLAATAGVEKYCFDFQNGACTRGTDCKYVHKKDPNYTPLGLRKSNGAGSPAGTMATGGGAGGGRGTQRPATSHPVTPKPKGSGANMVKIPAAIMWDVAGRKCCFRGPFFITKEPCQHPHACPYSHLVPYTSVQPANAHLAISHDECNVPPRGLGPGEDFIDFMLGDLPWQQDQSTSIMDSLTSLSLKALMAKRGKKPNHKLSNVSSDSENEDDDDMECGGDVDCFARDGSTSGTGGGLGENASAEYDLSLVRAYASSTNTVLPGASKKRNRSNNRQWCSGSSYQNDTSSSAQYATSSSSSSSSSSFEPHNQISWDFSAAVAKQSALEADRDSTQTQFDNNYGNVLGIRQNEARNSVRFSLASGLRNLLTRGGTTDNSGYISRIGPAGGNAQNWPIVRNSEGLILPRDGDGNVQMFPQGCNASDLFNERILQEMGSLRDYFRSRTAQELIAIQLLVVNNTMMTPELKHIVCDEIEAYTKVENRFFRSQIVGVRIPYDVGYFWSDEFRGLPYPSCLPQRQIAPPQMVRLPEVPSRIDMLREQSMTSSSSSRPISERLGTTREQSTTSSSSASAHATHTLDVGFSSSSAPHDVDFSSSSSSSAPQRVDLTPDSDTITQTSAQARSLASRGGLPEAISAYAWNMCQAEGRVFSRSYLHGETPAQSIDVYDLLAQIEDPDKLAKEMAPLQTGEVISNRTNHSASQHAHFMKTMSDALTLYAMREKRPDGSVPNQYVKHILKGGPTVREIPFDNIRAYIDWVFNPQLLHALLTGCIVLEDTVSDDTQPPVSSFVQGDPVPLPDGGQRDNDPDCDGPNSQAGMDAYSAASRVFVKHGSTTSGAQTQSSTSSSRKSSGGGQGHSRGTHSKKTRGAKHSSRASVGPKAFMMMVRDEDLQYLANATAMSVTSVSMLSMNDISVEPSDKLCWDTGASEPIADLIECLHDVTPREQPLVITGIGCKNIITYEGYDQRWPECGKFNGISYPLDTQGFNAQMCIKSVGKDNGFDHTGMSGFATFDDDGAFGSRVSPECNAIIKRIQQLAKRDGTYQEAFKVNNVYKAKCSPVAMAMVSQMQWESEQVLLPSRASVLVSSTTVAEEPVVLLVSALRDTAYALIVPIVNDDTLGIDSIGSNFTHLIHDSGEGATSLGTQSVDSLSDMLMSEQYTASYLTQDGYTFGSLFHTVSAAMCNLYGNRIKFTRRSALLQLLCDSGFSRKTLLDMLDRGTTGMPEGITRMAVERFFHDVGPGPLQDMAAITKHFRAEKARDLDPAFKVPGKLYQFDAFEVPFSKMVTSSSKGRLQTVPSFNGHKVVGVCIDVVTMAATLVSDVSWKHPERVLAAIIAQLRLQGHDPVEITADKQFVTPQCNLAVKPAVLRQSVPGAHDIWTPDVEGAIRWIKEMSLYNYNRALALTKAGVLLKSDCVRLWLYMVRLAVYQWNLRSSAYDKGKTRLEHIEGRKFNMFTRVILPFAFPLTAKCLQPAADGNRGMRGLYLLPSVFCDTGFHFFNLTTRRVSIVHSIKPDLSLTNRLGDEELLPTVLDIVGDVIESDQHLKSDASDLATSPSGGGVVGMDSMADMPDAYFDEPLAKQVPLLQVKAKVAKKVVDDAKAEAKVRAVDASRVLDNLRKDARVEQRAIIRDMEFLKHDNTSEAEKSRIRDRMAERSARQLAENEKNSMLVAALSSTSHSSARVKPNAVDRIFNKSADHIKSEEEMIAAFAAHGLQVEIAGEFQRDIQWMETLLEAIVKDNEANEEPSPMNVPKPPPFKRSDATSPVWKGADKREIDKILAEGTFGELPKDAHGQFIEPPNAIHQRLLKVREWKWKKIHPETKLPGWCACVRIVIDGSTDIRPDTYYALCPDRVLLFLLLSIAAVTESELSTADVERAYLNALAIDRNIVVIASSDLYPIPRRSLLIKALYGARCAAKSWQDWIDNKMIELGYKKLKICKGIYLKVDEINGAVLHAYRHSDDFLINCDDKKFKSDEEAGIKAVVRMSPFVAPTKFVGVEISRVDYETGRASPTGSVLVCRQLGKINEMEAEFADDIEALFPSAKGYVLKTPLPANHNRPVEELTERMQQPAGPELTTRMMEINGCVLWVASSTRHDLRFAVHWCSTKVAAPIFRDYYMCVHVMLYLIQTKMYPLLLGGPGECDAYGFSDGSLHTGSKMRSVGSYFVFASPLGGAIQSCTFESKYQVLNVMHIELDGVTQLANALLYISHACLELNVSTPITRRIYTDSEAAQSHCLNDSASKKSKHLELRLQTVQDYQEDDRIDVIYVPGGENCADQGTKSLDPETNLKHMLVILGHRMMPGKGIEGVQEWVPSKISRIQAAYSRATDFGYADVTVCEKSCDEMSSHFSFMAIVDPRELREAVLESAVDPALGEVVGYTEEEIYTESDYESSVGDELDTHTTSSPLYLENYPMVLTDHCMIHESTEGWLCRKDFKSQQSYESAKLEEMRMIAMANMWNSKGRMWLEHKVLDNAIHVCLLKPLCNLHRVPCNGYWEFHSDNAPQLEHVRKMYVVYMEISRTKFEGGIDSNDECYLSQGDNRYLHRDLSEIPWSILHTYEFENFFTVHRVPTLAITPQQLDAWADSACRVIGGGVWCSTGNEHMDLFNRRTIDSIEMSRLCIRLCLRKEGIVRIKPKMRWDEKGKVCCFRSPYFDHPLGACEQSLSCVYSHMAPVYSMKPHCVAGQWSIASSSSLGLEALNLGQHSAPSLPSSIEEEALRMWMSASTVCDSGASQGWSEAELYVLQDWKDFLTYRKEVQMCMTTVHEMPEFGNSHWSYRRFDYPLEVGLDILDHVISLYQSLCLIDESYLLKVHNTINDWAHGGCPTTPH